MIIISGLPVVLYSITILSPSLPVSSLTSEIPGTPSLNAMSPIFLTRSDLVTSNGIEVITICLFVLSIYLRLPRPLSSDDGHVHKAAAEGGGEHGRGVGVVRHD